MCDGGRGTSVRGSVEGNADDWPGEDHSMDVLSSRMIIHPSDLDRSLAFYGEGLDLSVAREFGSGERRGVVFFAGGGLIEVVGEGDPSPAGPPGAATGGHPDGPRLALWLQVRDVGATLEELASRGVEAVRPPMMEPWGLIEAWVDDPDALRIHLVEVPADHPLRRDQRDLVTPGGAP
jgi:predicted enzyme related to lactoylglutathione lyase